MSAIDYCQPFELLPNRVWRSYLGGKLLDEMEGKPAPTDSHFPEDWIGSATRAINPGREHVENEGIGVARGQDGRLVDMREFYQTDPVAALGKAHVRAFGPHPRLLVKLLDSAVRLQLQAHPTVEWARKHLHDDNGKTEAWLFLASRIAAPWVYFGFQRPPSPAEWRRILLEQDLPAMHACFDRIPVAPGDSLLVEGGIPHAIGEGLLLVEVQEPTDWVVRCEFSTANGLRLPDSATTMGRGVDGVLDLFDYTACPLEAIRRRFGPRPRITAETPGGGVEEALLEAPQTSRLEARRLAVRGAFAPPCDGRFSILIVVEGEGLLRAAGRAMPLPRWSRALLPAALDGFEIEGDLKAFRCLPPLPEKKLATKRRQAGKSRA